MACYLPLTMHRSKSGKAVPKPTHAWDLDPMIIPCGQCLGCRLEHSRQWAVRAVHESLMHDQNSFITLTLAPEHYPSDHSLNVRTWQLFAKRLRKAFGPFRFFHCGEYGDEDNRAHYHALIFGHDFSADRVLHHHNDQGDPLYTSEALASVWGLGFVNVGNLTMQSANYVSRYAMKKLNGQKGETHYRELAQTVSGNPDYFRVDEQTGLVSDGLKPEYATMSRRPGLGQKWFDKFRTDCFPHDQVHVDGKWQTPPDFYLRQLDPESQLTIREKRKALALEHAEDNTPARLQVRRQIKEARIRQLERKL